MIFALTFLSENKELVIKEILFKGFFQDFGNMTCTHGIGCFVKNWDKMHD
jgi:hypothetical protein